MHILAAIGAGEKVPPIQTANISLLHIQYKGEKGVIVSHIHAILLAIVGAAGCVYHMVDCAVMLLEGILLDGIAPEGFVAMVMHGEEGITEFLTYALP